MRDVVSLLVAFAVSVGEMVAFVVALALVLTCGAVVTAGTRWALGWWQ